MSEARSRRAGGPPGAILMRVGLKASSSIQLAYFGEFLGTAGGRKKGAPVLRAGREEWTGGGTKEGDEHVPPGLFAMCYAYTRTLLRLRPGIEFSTKRRQLETVIWWGFKM